MNRMQRGGKTKTDDNRRNNWQRLNAPISLPIYQRMAEENELFHADGASAAAE